MIVSIKEEIKPYDTRGLIEISRVSKIGNYNISAIGLDFISLKFDDGRERFVALKKPSKARLFKIFFIEKKYDWKEVVFDYIMKCFSSDEEFELNLTVGGIERILEDFLKTSSRRRAFVLSSVRLH